MTGPVLALNIFFTVLADSAFALLIGCFLAGQWRNASAPALRRISLASTAALFLAQLARPWFAASSMSGSSAFGPNLALIPDILTSTHQGKVWFLGSAALILLLLCPVRLRPAPLLLFACAKAASGHAAGAGDFTLAELSMFLHITGTAIWAGAIIVSGLEVISALEGEALWTYARLLSTTVTWALAALLLSGLFTSYSELNGALSGLWTSNWGRILLTKLAFVAIALALGATTRFRCVQLPPTTARAALMRRLMRAEAAAMILILCLSGALANTPPAMTEDPPHEPGLAASDASR